ncbi:MAG: dockerin type I domain-containing protein, partial [Planctomycetota bacterium]
GSMLAWGRNDEGQCNVPSDSGYQHISAGFYHSAATRSNETSEGWGTNTFQVLDIPPQRPFVKIVCGIGHSAGVLPDGSVQMWGFNQFGQTDVPAGTYAMLTAGQGHTVAIQGTPCPAAAGEPDANQNGIHDRCECLADLSGDRRVNFIDLLLVINVWGPVELGTTGDVDGDGVVQFNDLLIVLDAYSSQCPL